MRLIADASILVAELLRSRGRALIANPSLDLFLAEHVWSETLHELPKRALLMEQQGRLPPGAGARLIAAARSAIDLSITLVPTEAYLHLEATARARVPRDPNDWPTVALALGAGIWTRDNDFLGCGVATWTTETLLAHLGEQA